MTCPQCRTRVAKDGNKAFPFCSERCQLVDLGRWLTEEYRVPVDDIDGPPVVRPPVDENGS